MRLVQFHEASGQRRLGAIVDGEPEQHFRIRTL
jgi:hypothetical protein